MIQETVSIPTKEGHSLTGVLRIPDYAGVFPAALVCHDFLGNKNRELMIDLANETSRARMVTLRFDFSCCGESGGQPPYHTLSQHAADIRAAIDLLYSVQQVDKEKIAVIGHGLGAMAALVAQDPRVKAYVTINMRSNADGFIASYFSEAEIKEWKASGVYDCQEIHRLHVNFLEDMRKQDIIDALLHLIRPILIVQATNDKRTPVEEARALFYHAKFPTLELVEGADHNFSDKKSCHQAIRVMVEWLQQKLQ